MVHPLRCEFGQCFGHFKGSRVAEAKVRRIIHFRRLRLDGLDDPGVSMACVAAPQTGHHIEDLTPVGGVVKHAIGACNQARVFLERPIARKRHPK